MTFDKLKELWLENKLAIANKQNKETFEALKLLCSNDLPWQFDGEEDNFRDIQIIKVKKWEDLKKLSHYEYFYNDGSEYFSFENLILEPKEILKSIT